MNFNKARFYRSIRKSQFLGGIFRNIQDAIPRLVRYSFFNRLSMIARADGHHLWRDARVISRIRSPKISHFRKVNLSCIGRIEKLISLERINDIYRITMHAYFREANWADEGWQRCVRFYGYRWCRVDGIDRLMEYFDQCQNCWFYSSAVDTSILPRWITDNHSTCHRQNYNSCKEFPQVIYHTNPPSIFFKNIPIY